MPAFAETQVESGFASCLKSASDLISICRKSANFSRLLIIQVLGIRCISRKYFRVRFVLFLYFVLSFENCLIWAFVSDCQLYIQDEDISNPFVFEIRNSNPKFKTKRQDAGMCRNSGWVKFLRTFSSCLKSDVNLIWNSRKRANALVKIFFAEKYFRVRFLILLYFVLSIENCLIWAFVSDCICFFCMRISRFAHEVVHVQI
jgi:hypothetical protein